MAVQHVCDVCGRTMTEWRNLLIGRIGTAPSDTRIWRADQDAFRGEIEKEVCASCYGTLDLWLRGVMNGVTPPNAITDAIGTASDTFTGAPVRILTTNVSGLSAAPEGFFDSPGYNAPMNT